MTEELREKIARYIAKEIALRDTPAYSLSAKEQSYGIVAILRDAGYVKITPEEAEEICETIEFIDNKYSGWFFQKTTDMHKLIIAKLKPIAEAKDRRRRE